MGGKADKNQDKSLVKANFLVSGIKAGKPGWVGFDMHLHCPRQTPFSRSDIAQKLVKGNRIISFRSSLQNCDTKSENGQKETFGKEESRV